MHILFLTDNFPPEVNAPASRTFEHCREWVLAGHQVTVITGAPNFPRGVVFPGYRNRLVQTETMAGIRVVRVWTFICANEGFLGRTLDYLSFMVSAFVAALFVRRVDVVVGTSPQFFTVCAAWLSAFLRRAPFVFELRDLWPESIRVVGALRQGRVLRLLERVELFLYRRAALIVAVTHSYREILAKRGIDPGKVAVVTNGADLSRFKPMAKDAGLMQSLGLEGQFVAGYIGTHGMAHGLDTLLDAAAMLKSRGETDVRILMLGDGAEKASLLARARREALDNVVFVDTVSKDQVRRYWSLLDVSIIHLRRDPLFRSVIPSKLFEAMAMGIPVVMGVEGEAAEIVTRHDVGSTVLPQDADALVTSILNLRDDPERYTLMRDNGLQAASRYSRPTLAASMLHSLEAFPNRRALVTETEAA